MRKRLHIVLRRHRAASARLCRLVCNLHTRQAPSPRPSSPSMSETPCAAGTLGNYALMARRLPYPAQRVFQNIRLGGGTMKALMTRLWRSEEGQDLAEYALLIALIALVVIAAVTALGGQIQTVFNNIANALNP